MVIDKGFFVENYVGNYEMQFNQELNATFIVSKEVNHAKDNELPLLKKRIFEFDRKDDEYIFLQLANVDISSDSSILEYCNKYGLPYSSQICFDEESGLDESVEEDVAQQISMRISAAYSREDTMTRLEFCRLAVQVRSLMELKEILDRPHIDQTTCSKLIPLLTYLIFYSREFIYDCDTTDPLPHTRIMNLQYSFNFFCNLHRDFLRQLPPADQISTFLAYYKNLIKNMDRVKDSMLLSDLASVENLRVLRVFEHVFLGDQCSLGAVVPDNVTTHVISLGEHSLLAEIGAAIIHAKKQFTVDDYRRVIFDDEIKYDGDMDDLKQLSFDVLRDAVNEGLTQINPRLIFEDGILCGEWQLRHQMEGIYMEFFIEIAKNSQYRLCANPTCGKFFSASRSYPNKKYCCHECAVLQAKRNGRAKMKSKSSKVN